MQAVQNLDQCLFPIQGCALRYLHRLPLCSMSLLASGLADCHHAALASWLEADWDIQWIPCF